MQRGGQTYTFRPTQTPEDLMAQGQQAFDAAPAPQDAPSAAPDLSVGLGGLPSGEPVDRDEDAPVPQDGVTPPPPPQVPLAAPAPPTLAPFSKPTAAPPNSTPLPAATPLAGADSLPTKWAETEMTVTLVLKPLKEGDLSGR